MWVAILVLALGILALLGGVLLGGVFTIVLVPLALIGLGSGVVYAMWGRATQAGEGGATDSEHAPERPLPNTLPRDSGRAPTSPERLADARRVQQ
ncbi:MAG: hypothetical protein JO206_01605 [Solirubrobacterales bacterium]|nr:hypothetical protein [Solirubrobacterales bacterium]MBV9471633.1 hypothetical protein [Solirubrobacterales bacterium]